MIGLIRDALVDFGMARHVADAASNTIKAMLMARLVEKQGSHNSSAWYGLSLAEDAVIAACATPFKED